MSANSNVEIKNVILPFDFSTSAYNSLEHAISLARKFRAELTILNVNDSFSSHALHTSGESFLHYENTAKQKLAEITKGIFIFNTIHTLVSSAKWMKALEMLLSGKENSMIVFPMEGKSRDSFFDISNTYKVVESLMLPILIVKESQKTSDYKTITTTLDETFHTREKLPYVNIMAKAFESKVSIVGIQTHQDKDTVNHMNAILRQCAQYVSAKAREYEARMIQAKNTGADVTKSAEEDKADLLIIMNEHEKTLTNIFSSPYASQVVENSKIPVLMCPPRVSLVMDAVSI